MATDHPQTKIATLDHSFGAMVQLTVVEGRSAGRRFKIEGIASIGRSPDSIVMLDDTEISRQHARLSRDANGGYLLEDLGSKNGTFVNGLRVESRLLAYGDRIRLGPRMLLEFNAFDAVEEIIVQRQRFEAIGRLGVGIAHDLNNVLAALDAGASFLRELPPERALGEKEVRECISDLSMAAARAGALTRGILSFARGRGSARAPVDVSSLLEEVVRMLKHTLDQSIRIESSVEPGVIVHGGESELHQVLLNLCLNARDAMTEGGTLSVSASRIDPPAGGGYEAGRKVALLRVADTGVGMDAETQRRIFEPFFTTKREGAGYGLGLATVREIVSIHGGHIGIDSEPGLGSTFSVYLPTMDPELIRFANTQEKPPTPLRAARSGVRILLVDDEQIVRRSMGRLLRQAGFVVTEAASGVEAIALYAEQSHDLVLLDVDMPGLDGEQTQARLVQATPWVRIIFASGHADPKREAAVRARGALGFLQKPFGLDALLTLVNEVLADSWREREELTRPK
jgi:signal transduction histidine kinase/CheY-like chemotaxis protein